MKKIKDIFDTIVEKYSILNETFDSDRLEQDGLFYVLNESVIDELLYGVEFDTFLSDFSDNGYIDSTNIPQSAWQSELIEYLIMNIDYNNIEDKNELFYLFEEELVNLNKNEIFHTLSSDLKELGYRGVDDFKLRGTPNDIGNILYVLYDSFEFLKDSWHKFYNTILSIHVGDDIKKKMEQHLSKKIKTVWSELNAYIIIKKGGEYVLFSSKNGDTLEDFINGSPKIAVISTDYVEKLKSVSMELKSKGLDMFENLVDSVQIYLYDGLKGDKFEYNFSEGMKINKKDLIRSATNNFDLFGE